MWGRDCIIPNRLAHPERSIFRRGHAVAKLQAANLQGRPWVVNWHGNDLRSNRISFLRKPHTCLEQMDLFSPFRKQAFQQSHHHDMLQFDPGIPALFEGFKSIWLVIQRHCVPFCLIALLPFFHHWRRGELRQTQTWASKGYMQIKKNIKSTLLYIQYIYI